MPAWDVTVLRGWVRHAPSTSTSASNLLTHPIEAIDTLTRALQVLHNGRLFEVTIDGLYQHPSIDPRGPSIVAPKKCRRKPKVRA